MKLYSKIKIDIEDNGIGISEENINKLFIDFGKLEDNQQMNFQGTGLGLSICKRIIEQMGGQVSVYSKINKGTTFSFTVCSKIMI
jgi:signal transduction histidine kinase